MKKIIITIIVFGMAWVVAAQQSTSTPNPVSTGTPSPDVSTPPANTSQQAFEPFTQADLEVVTGNVQRPNGITWYNNKLYTVCTGDSTIYEIDSVTGQTITYIGGVRNAHSLYADETEENALSLWVPDFETDELLHITRSGIDRVASDLNGPWGIAALDEERFLITSLLGNTLMMLNREGEGETILDGLASPTGIVVDDDAIYIANNGSTRRAIEVYPTSVVDGEEAEPTVLVSGLQNTTGLALGEDGYLYFAFSLGTRGLVGRADPNYCRENGPCTAEDVDIVVYTELEAPLAGLTFSDDMRLFIHTMFRPEIYWVQIDS